MKIIEESKLKENIRQLNKYERANREPSVFFNNLDSLEFNSLQSVSFVQDDAFFDEISFILNVIASIISHPHLSNKGEDVIIRSELAGHISVESFQRTFKEPSFWKEKDLEMAPEYVHHYQYTDEIRIYENIFIGMVVKLLDQEVTEYIEFYNQLIPSIDNNNSNELLEDENTEIALRKLSVLRRKLKFIKNSYFYKEVSKVKFSLKNLQPTNILVKDRLYNHCYRFYKKFIQYIDKESLTKDFNTYYYLLVVKILKKNGFVLDESKKQTKHNLHLYNNGYYANVLLEKGKSSILLQISLDGSNYISKHRLVLNTDRDIEDLYGVNTNDVLTVEFATLWNIKDSSNLKHFIFKNAMLEEEVAAYWVNSKFEERAIKQNMFTRYCPVCKGDNLDENKEIYTCHECESIYTFKKENLAWFLRLRRF